MFKCKEKKLEAKTRYDKVKQTKKDNFTFLNKTCCKKGQTVLVGDSITEIWNVTDLFASYTEKTSLAVYNRGISGDTSDRLFERFFENVILIEPKNIVLLIGTNDLGVGTGTDFTASNIKKILDMIKNECPDCNVILQAIYPVNKSIDKYMVGARKNRDIKTVNEKLKSLAEEYKIIFADFTHLLSDEKGNFNSEFTYDGLHPNAKGFAAVTNEILKLL